MTLTLWHQVHDPIRITMRYATWVQCRTCGERLK